MATTATAVDAKVEALRAELPATTHTVYLNTGTCGPLPRKVHAAMLATLEEEFSHGRTGPRHYPELIEAGKRVKEVSAQILGCDAGELSITDATRDGMNIAIAGYPWQRGDEIITSNIEHPGGLAPTFLTKKRYGTRVRIADIGVGDMGTEATVREFERLITPRTRMIAISHISYTTGAVLPVKEIVEMAHSRDVLVAVDAAQSYAHLPLDLHALGVDFYACPGQKWVCGPEGTGVFYARAESVGEIGQVFVGGSGAVQGSLDYYGADYQVAPGAARFDRGGDNLSLLVGQRVAAEWFLHDVGPQWAYERIERLGRYAAAMFRAMPGVTVVTPEANMAGLIAFAVDGIDPVALMDRLREDHGITIRYVVKYINNPKANRIATGFYNTEEELDRLGAAIREIQGTL